MTTNYSSNNPALSAARALIVAQGSLAELEAWHQQVAGPKIALTKTYTGTFTVADQSDADDLAGTAVKGKVLVTAGGTPSNPLRLRKFLGRRCR